MVGSSNWAGDTSVESTNLNLPFVLDFVSSNLRCFSSSINTSMNGLASVGPYLLATPGVIRCADNESSDGEYLIGGDAMSTCPWIEFNGSDIVAEILSNNNFLSTFLSATPSPFVDSVLLGSLPLLMFNDFLLCAWGSLTERREVLRLDMSKLGTEGCVERCSSESDGFS